MKIEEDELTIWQIVMIICFGALLFYGLIRDL